jgi:hypothetical protein
LNFGLFLAPSRKRCCALQYFAKKYGGKLIMRFDDTNPAKENAEYEKVSALLSRLPSLAQIKDRLPAGMQVILEDLNLMGIQFDMFSHTSDHFDTLASRPALPWIAGSTTAVPSFPAPWTTR